MLFEKLILIKGRYGIMFFLLSFSLTAILAPYRVEGGTLILNIVIFGGPGVLLLISLIYLSEKPFFFLTLAMVIGSIDVLWSFYVFTARLVVTGKVDNIYHLIFGGGIRLLALWAIWSTLRQVKRLSRPNSPHRET